MGKNIFFFTSSQMENFTEIFRFEKFFIYLKEERQKDKIIMADRIDLFKKRPIPSLDPPSLLITRNSVNSHDAVRPGPTANFHANSLGGRVRQ